MLQTQNYVSQLSAMAAIEAVFPIFSSRPSTSTSSKCPLHYRPSISLKLPLSSPPTIRFSLNRPLTRKPSFIICSAVQEAEPEAEAEVQAEPVQQEGDLRRKLFVLNLPWSLSVADIKTLFGECGSVADVEIIKQKDGKSRGFAFVTMASGEEAQAVIDKFNSHELSGRVIGVEFAKRLKPPRPSPPASPNSPQAPPREKTAAHVVYAGNLAWKARSSHLREFFSESNPVSAKVVFDSPGGRSTGYGFVSFDTKEQAEAAVSSLDGKELMGRAIRLKISEKKSGKSENQEEVNPEEQPASKSENQEEGNPEEQQPASAEEQ